MRSRILTVLPLRSRQRISALNTNWRTYYSKEINDLDISVPRLTGRTPLIC
jgi:hypothetical protein